jgi:hypothetical protein
VASAHANKVSNASQRSSLSRECIPGISVIVSVSQGRLTVVGAQRSEADCPRNDAPYFAQAANHMAKFSAGFGAEYPLLVVERSPKLAIKRLLRW